MKNNYYIVYQIVNIIILLSENAYKNNCKYLLEYLKENSITSRTILVKGSRGIALEQTIAYLK